MNVNMTEEWCINMAKLEGNSEIGAGAVDPISCAIMDAKEFVEAASTDGFDPNDALDLIREFAALGEA